MYKIKEIILWPFDSGKSYRKIKFSSNKVNVITGDSRTGKTALIACIDYVLGSSKCMIPVGVIREKCKWYGVIMKNDVSEILIARRNPDTSLTPEFYFFEDKVVDIPNTIEKGNYSSDNLKDYLNNLLGYSQLKLSANEDSEYNTRPSYRDTMAFNFQPQTIIATPDTLFYKVNLTSHRERLKREIDYFLNIIDNEELFNREKSKNLKKELKDVENMILKEKELSNIFLQKVPKLMTEAISYGFFPKSKVLSEDSFTNLGELRKLLKSEVWDSYGISEKALKQMHNTFSEFERKLANKYQEILKHTSLINSIDKSINVINDYKLSEMEESLRLTEWLAEKILNDDFLLSNLINNDVSIEDITNSVKKYKIDKFISERELENLLEEKRIKEYSLQKLVDEYDLLNEQLNEMKKSEEIAKKDNDIIKNKYMFLGRLKSEIEKIDQSTNLDELNDKKRNITLQISQLQVKNDKILKEKFNRINQEISDYSLDILSTLDCDHKGVPINFERNELTISIVTGERKDDKDYLYEIGSASNWLSYHIAFMLALHKYFLSIDNSKVFPFIVFDQPSQVYFPDGFNQKNGIRNRSNDIEKVKMIFKTIDRFAKNNDLQIIILEHAGEDLWDNLEMFHTVEEWGETNKFVPIDW
ncbi:DUF3732 domain-containing protein [Longibaculum muris]|uniref:DUF3732 domain-containing protein n=1 Tax=Longibaculum muris TaxID=1796628 RepID=UPI0012B8BE73|nr:DUF3732 domain-containing protein [Longibaculum muris]